MNIDVLPPALSLPMTGGTFTPASLQGQWSVLYFYPKDATPGCTTQGQDFRDSHADFERLGARIYGVSRDSLASHERFADKQGFPFALVSDEDEVLCRAFEVIKEKNMYGKTVLGIERSTFLLNPQGEVVRQWRKVKVDGHVAEVLAALQAEVKG